MNADTSKESFCVNIDTTIKGIHSVNIDTTVKGIHCVNTETTVKEIQHACGTVCALLHFHVSSSVRFSSH